jgi:hypothetical protein
VSGAKSIGKAALATGSKIVNDIASKQEASKIKDNVANRISESFKCLTDKLQQRTKKAKFNDVFAYI